ncbi:MAG TPA: SIS domain-containing protein [Patescibacteria group bacterium]
MQSLDNLTDIEKLDKGKILTSIVSLPDQIKQAWEEVSMLNFGKEYEGVQSLIVSGMGGSALGGRIIDSLFADRLRVPLEIVTDYHLPHYVNSKTLVILSSYSGNTEETIAAAHDAISKKAKVFVVATGGKLAELVNKEKLIGYVFNPIHNPSNQPRMGLGYSLGIILALLGKNEFITVSKEEINELTNSASEFVHQFGVRAKEDQNIAKLLATKLHNKMIMLMASEHLSGVSYAFKNQINENAKNFSALFEISESNHHLLEGLKFPSGIKDKMMFLMFESPHYYERVLKRYPITKDVIEKNGYKALTYKTTSKTKLEEVVEILVLGSYISFYLAMLEGIDPSPIPWVDYFKEKLA